LKNEHKYPNPLTVIPLTPATAATTQGQKNTSGKITEMRFGNDVKRQTDTRFPQEISRSKRRLMSDNIKGTGVNFCKTPDSFHE